VVVEAALVLMDTVATDVEDDDWSFGSQFSCEVTVMAAEFPPALLLLL